MPRKPAAPKRPRSQARQKAKVIMPRAKLHHVAYVWAMFVLACSGLALHLPIARAQVARPHHKGVLAYATSVSASALLDVTNQQRGANGVGNLQLNAKLNQAAQAKANDMA